MLNVYILKSKTNNFAQGPNFNNQSLDDDEREIKLTLKVAKQNRGPNMTDSRIRSLFPGTFATHCK